MADDKDRQERAPDTGQESGGEEGKSTPPNPSPTESVDPKLRAARDEAAARRVALQEARSKIEELQAQVQSIEEAKLEEQGKYRELYEKQKARADEVEQRYRERLITTALRGKLRDAGVDDPEVQDLILPGVRAKASLDLDDDLQLTGELDPVLTSVRERFAALTATKDEPEPEPEKPKRKPNATLGALGAQVPTSDSDGKEDPRQALRRAIMDSLA